MQGERRQQAAALLGLLNGLWEVLEVGPEDVDRTIFTGLLTSPAPMHRQTLDKVHCPPLWPCALTVPRIRACLCEQTVALQATGTTQTARALGSAILTSCSSTPAALCCGWKTSTPSPVPHA